MKLINFDEDTLGLLSYYDRAINDVVLCIGEPVDRKVGNKLILGFDFSKRLHRNEFTYKLVKTIKGLAPKIIKVKNSPKDMHILLNAVYDLSNKYVTQYFYSDYPECLICFAEGFVPFMPNSLNGNQNMKPQIVQVQILLVPEGAKLHELASGKIYVIKNGELILRDSSL